MTLQIFTGYKWREMKPDEIEIMFPEKIVLVKPDEPEAGDIYEEAEHEQV